MSRRSITRALLVAAAAAAAPASALAPPAQRTVLQVDYGDVVEAAPAPALALGSEFTVELWVNLYEADANGLTELISKWLPDGRAGLLVFLADGGRAPVLHFVDASGAGNYVSGPPLPIGEWVHVAATLGGGTLRLFVDGEQVAPDAPASGPPVANEAAPLRLGWQLRGALRQARVWSRALPAAEIAQRAAAAVLGDEPGLAAAWPLDDGAGRSARDLTAAAGPVRLVPGWFAGDSVWVRTATVDTPFFSVTTSPAARAYNGPGALLDLDLDDDPDLLLWAATPGSFAPSPLESFRNDGTQGFHEATAAHIAAPGVLLENAGPPGIADFTRDGLPDVMVGDYGPDLLPFPGGQPRLLVRRPDGGLRDDTASRLPELRVVAGAQALADVDCDGDIDSFHLAFGDASDPKLTSRLLLNDAAGHFVEKADWLSAEWNGVFLGHHFVDADGDGDPDLFLGSSGQSGYPRWRDVDRLLVNDGHGVFTDSQHPAPLPRRYRGFGFASGHAVAADFDGDGREDVAVALSEIDLVMGAVGVRLHLLLANGDGSFRDASIGVPQGRSLAMTGRLVAADVNRDGRVDLVKSEATNARQELLLNLGDARFVDASEVYPVGHAYLVPGDLDGDGDVDFAGYPWGRPEVMALTAVRPLDLAAWDDYSLCVFPGHLDVPIGRSAALQVAVNRAGFAAPVELSVVSATPGLSFAFSAGTITGDETVSLTVSAAPSVPPGRYQATVMARSGEVAHSQEIVLVVSRPPTPLRRGTRGGG